MGCAVAWEAALVGVIAWDAVVAKEAVKRDAVLDKVATRHSNSSSGELSWKEGSRITRRVPGMRVGHDSAESFPDSCFQACHAHILTVVTISFKYSFGEHSLVPLCRRASLAWACLQHLFLYQVRGHARKSFEKMHSLMVQC